MPLWDPALETITRTGTLRSYVCVLSAVPHTTHVPRAISTHTAFPRPQLLNLLLLLAPSFWSCCATIPPFSADRLCIQRRNEQWLSLFSTNSQPHSNSHPFPSPTPLTLAFVPSPPRPTPTTMSYQYTSSSNTQQTTQTNGTVQNTTQASSSSSQTQTAQSTEEENKIYYYCTKCGAPVWMDYSYGRDKGNKCYMCEYQLCRLS